jgi:hypothetical protein
MKVRLVFVVLGLLAAGAPVTGCGGDDKKGSAADTRPAAAAATTDSAGGAKVDPNNPQIKAAVDACKQQVQANAQLSDSVKSDLEKICATAASGDAAAAQKASGEVCRKIVEATAPAGPARDQALTACDQVAAG